MARHEMQFVGSAGAPLDGVVDVPDIPAVGSVLMVHCFTCAKDLHTLTRLSRALVEAGYATMRFDFTGLGSSGGDFTSTSVTTNVGDISRAAFALIERGYGPCGLFGHSLGGAAALIAAERLKTVRSVVTLGAPSAPGHVRHLLAGRDDQIRTLGSAEVSIGGRPFTIGREFVDDLDRHQQGELVSRLGRPLMIIHAPDDDIVPVSEGEAIFAAAQQPKAFMPLVDADHLVSRRRDADRLADVVVGWFDATLS